MKRSRERMRGNPAAGSSNPEAVSGQVVPMSQTGKVRGVGAPGGYSEPGGEGRAPVPDPRAQTASPGTQDTSSWAKNILGLAATEQQVSPSPQPPGATRDILMDRIRAGQAGLRPTPNTRGAGEQPRQRRVAPAETASAQDATLIEDLIGMARTAQARLGIVETHRQKTQDKLDNPVLKPVVKYTGGYTTPSHKVTKTVKSRRYVERWSAGGKNWGVGYSSRPKHKVTYTIPGERVQGTPHVEYERTTLSGVAQAFRRLSQGVRWADTRRLEGMWRDSITALLPFMSAEEIGHRLGITLIEEPPPAQGPAPERRQPPAAYGPQAEQKRVRRRIR